MVSREGGSDPEASVATQRAAAAVGEAIAKSQVRHGAAMVPRVDVLSFDIPTRDVFSAPDVRSVDVSALVRELHVTGAGGWRMKVEFQKTDPHEDDPVPGPGARGDQRTSGGSSTPP